MIATSSKLFAWTGSNGNWPSSCIAGDLQLIGMARCYFVETATAGDIWTCDDNGRLVRQYFCLFVFVLYFCICKTFFCGAGDIWKIVVYLYFWDIICGSGDIWTCDDDGQFVRRPWSSWRWCRYHRCRAQRKWLQDTSLLLLPLGRTRARWDAVLEQYYV